jgi:NADPH:quinone reductase-like Zn-dependent oxidoreductase
VKAIVQNTYGPPGVLRLEEVEKMVANDGAVLLRVHAAAVNPT